MSVYFPWVSHMICFWFLPSGVAQILFLNDVNLGVLACQACSTVHAPLPLNEITGDPLDSIHALFCLHCCGTTLFLLDPQVQSIQPTVQLISLYQWCRRPKLQASLSNFIEIIDVFPDDSILPLGYENSNH